MKVFVDTNLLLDVLAKREPFYAGAARIWTLAETGASDELASAISFNNVFYIVRKARDTAAARHALVLLRDVFASVAPDQRILNQAIDSEPHFRRRHPVLHRAARARRLPADAQRRRLPHWNPADAHPR